MKKIVLASAVAATLLCSTGVYATPEITLGLSNWPGWVAWYVAEHNGYFKKYHANFKLVWFSSYETSVEALSAGKIDANCQALIDSIAPIEKGVNPPEFCGGLYSFLMLLLRSVVSTEHSSFPLLLLG
ncbi:MAG: hypothetical protein U7M05_08630 [Candidatus Igneacidithiobacillus chanchocoensis]